MGVGDSEFSILFSGMVLFVVIFGRMGISMSNAKKKTTIINKAGAKNTGRKNLFMGNYSTTLRRFFQLILIFLVIVTGMLLLMPHKNKAGEKIVPPKESYWMLLHRKSNVEYLYKGIAGDKSKSYLIKTFLVKPGIP